MKPGLSPRWLRAGGIAAALIAVALIAQGRANKQTVGTDFHVFWQAGYDFAHGLPLYRPLPGARSFIYPPFAAQTFQLLSVFPLKVAAWWFYVASVVLAGAAIWLSRDILLRLRPGNHQIAPLILGVLLSAVFVIDNLDHVQINLVIFVLCLLGVRSFLARREAAASGWIAAATAIKLTPVFFAVWLVVRGSRRTFGLMAVSAGATLGLPFIQRGITQGAADLVDYYRAFLHQFAAGGVVTNYRNQNLAAMVYRAVVPGSSGDAPYDYAYLPDLGPWAPLLYRSVALAVLGLFLVHVVRLRASRTPIGSLEIASVFLASHLLSGITWKAHLVSLLFVFYAFFTLTPARMRSTSRAALYVAWAGIAVIGLGRDVIGSRLHHYLAGYSAFVWVMMLLFVLCVLWSRRTAER